jgi:hypothetical protein
MPYCPNCRTEYIKGIAVCSDCGAVLADRLPPPAPHPDDSELVSVFQAPDQFMAITVKSLLTDNGIGADIRSRQMPMYDGMAMMHNPVWGHVVVLDRDEERARLLIEAYTAGQGADPGSSCGVERPVPEGRPLRHPDDEELTAIYEDLDDSEVLWMVALLKERGIAATVRAKRLLVLDRDADRAQEIIDGHLDAVRKCPACGADLPAAAKFCMQCGARAADAPDGGTT